MQEQKLNKLIIDPVNAKDFERAFKTQSKRNEPAERSSSNNGQVSDSKPPQSDQAPETSDYNTASANDAEI